MSSVLTARACSTPYSSSPKSSPTGPTTRTSVKNDAAREKWTADPFEHLLALPERGLHCIESDGTDDDETHEAAQASGRRPQCRGAARATTARSTSWSDQAPRSG